MHPRYIYFIGYGEIKKDVFVLCTHETYFIGYREIKKNVFVLYIHETYISKDIERLRRMFLYCTPMRRIFHRISRD